MAGRMARARRSAVPLLSACLAVGPTLARAEPPAATDGPAPFAALVLGGVLLRSSAVPAAQAAIRLGTRLTPHWELDLQFGRLQPLTGAAMQSFWENRPAPDDLEAGVTAVLGHPPNRARPFVRASIGYAHEHGHDDWAPTDRAAA